ncbi:hypothetical protein BN1095_6480002 [Clostridioides difficile]|uniref:Uncharacterized protein n=1 Tax=Clostridioides difficile TaxID=1496 RepID=A0A069B0S6_CLODI|nr:hypothetical protein BN1095_6480002 [Clostridioides difficile]
MGGLGFGVCKNAADAGAAVFRRQQNYVAMVQDGGKTQIVRTLYDQCAAGNLGCGLSD